MSRMDVDLFTYEVEIPGLASVHVLNFAYSKILRDLRLRMIIRMIGFRNANDDVPWDGKLKDKALKNKANVEGIIDEDDESHNEGWRRWDGYENTIHDHEERENEEERVDPTSIDRIP
ncbi:hypothetical protein Tco_1241874 [Tanacetum coccineum]